MLRTIKVWILRGIMQSLEAERPPVLRREELHLFDQRDAPESPCFGPGRVEWVGLFSGWSSLRSRKRRAAVGASPAAAGAGGVRAEPSAARRNDFRGAQTVEDVP